MANLQELANVQDWSISDPSGDAANPKASLARAFRARVRMMLVRRCGGFINAMTEDEDPAMPQKKNREMLAFARQVLRSPTLHLETIFNFILATRPLAETVDTLLLLNGSDLDAAVKNKDLALLARDLGS